MKRLPVISLAMALLLFAQPASTAPASAAATEYRLKAAILFNFVLFTEWPPSVGTTLHLCSAGNSPIDRELEALSGKAVGVRRIVVVQLEKDDPIQACQIVFIGPTAMSNLPAFQAILRGRPVLTAADTPGAARKGVILNLAVVNNRVNFEVNSRSARAAGLRLSSKLLNLATHVYQ